MWGGDPGRCLIAVKGSLQFFDYGVTFRSRNTRRPYKTLLPRVHMREPCDYLFHYHADNRTFTQPGRILSARCREKKRWKQPPERREEKTVASTPAPSVFLPHPSG